MITTDQNPKKLREITSGMVSKLFSVQGIIVTTSKPFLKASVLKVQCKSCGHIKDIPLAPGQSPYIPRKCVVSTN
jgi:DNA replicative helicase MCM subunit Mcm2 (Cdc46/Mcm family)